MLSKTVRQTFTFDIVMQSGWKPSRFKSLSQIILAMFDLMQQGKSRYMQCMTQCCCVVLVYFNFFDKILKALRLTWQKVRNYVMEVGR